MKNILFNILAVLIGLFVGATVNGAIINVSGSVIPPPEGFDLTTESGLRAAMEVMEPKHFLFPFLAHSFGALVGAVLATLIARTNKLLMALLIGIVFMAGGIFMISILPSPMWFNVTDLVLAYLPMAYLGYWLVNRKK